MKTVKISVILVFLLLCSFLLGMAVGGGGIQEIFVPSTNIEPQQSVEPGGIPIPDVQLLELHIYKDELMLDIPIPAFRFEIKFRSPQEINSEIKVDLHFKGALKEWFGSGGETNNRVLMEEHFGWIVYTYELTMGGDTLPSELLNEVTQSPHLYASVCVVEDKAGALPS